MLVLSRRKNETIVIRRGDTLIELCVVEIRGSTVRLGLVAPPEVKIMREELLDRDKQRAAG